MSSRSQSRLAALVLFLVLPASLVGCFVVKKKADEAAGTAVTGAVREHDPELATAIEKEAAKNVEAGVEYPWLQAIKTNWVGIVLTLLFGTTGTQLYRTHRKAGMRGAIAEALSAAITQLGPGAAEKVAQAAKNHPSLPSGSVRDIMAGAGLKPSR